MSKKKIFLFLLLAIFIAIPVSYVVKVWLPIPELSSEEFDPIVFKKTETHIEGENGSWLRKNDADVWEMYLEGNPLERGLYFGEMARQLNAEKESAFIKEIKNRIPSPSYLNFLKYMIGWFNRDMDTYIANEYLEEIYGASRSLPDSMDDIAGKYHRSLSYHGAHDIGHALQNMNLVGCTSIASWGDNTSDNQLLIGRNFDFYFGREFAKDPIIAFVKPNNGYAFMSVTWACFSGVVSGMNSQGLTVTLNSAKSDIPSKGKTPVSIIAREILQYAATIDEAYAIAKKHDSFVAETFLIGSKNDGRAALIEKTPNRTELFEGSNDELIVTNHFQSDSLINTPLNQEYMAELVSTYRYDRVAELADSLKPIAPEGMAHLLRDKQGLEGENIGLSNEKSINQLLAHHSIIFKPEELKVWVSSPPFQLGKYLAYDLNEIFADPKAQQSYIDSLSIPMDSFSATMQFAAFQKHVLVKEKIETFLFTGNDFELSDLQLEEMIAGNANGFLTYYYLGNYYKAKSLWKQAVENYDIGLAKNVARVSERNFMIENRDYCLSQIHD